jgi:integrase
MHADGGGLYLQATVNSRDGHTAKSWIYRYMLRGRAREMGLGSFNAISLQQARAKAFEYRRLRQEGIDPIDARKAKREQSILENAKVITFAEAASEYIESHQGGWRNPKHTAQWRATIATYAQPIIGSLFVQAVNTDLVLKVLKPIWNSKPQTASRLRGRIELVLDWARARGYRQGENPARWRGHLDKLLPAPAKVRRVEHHPALSYSDMPQFMAALRQQSCMAARALEFAILTAARTGEVIGARWNEIDLDQALWIVPGNRMKAGREHRVPLSARALALLGDLPIRDDRPGQFLFPGSEAGRSLSNMALLMLLRRMGRGDLTTHGFRSTFRDWAAEQTHFPGEMAELALAHTVGNKVEAAYRRGDQFDRRCGLMESWAAFCGLDELPGKVVVLPTAKRATL